MPAKKGLNLLYPLVISIIIVLGLVAALISIDSTAQEIYEEALDDRAELKEKNDQFREARAEILSLKELISAGGEVRPEIIRGTHFQDWKDQVERIAKERGTEVGESKSEYTNLVEIYDEMKEELLWQSGEIARLKSERTGARQDIETERATKEDLRREKDAQVTDLQEQLTREQNSRQEDNRRNSGEIQRLVDQAGEQANQMEETRRSYRVRVAELQSLLSEKDDRITELVKKQAETLATAEPDGEILHADNQMSLAWINLGRTHGLPRGLPFDVFQVKKGGRRKLKGRIEVLDLEDHMAKVAIVQTVDATDPIVKGDYVISPLFDKSEQKIFVLVGEMVNADYGRQEIIRKIVEAGSKVDAEVTVQTDYIVAGKDAELLPEFQRALQLGIRVMREGELLKFLAP